MLNLSKNKQKSVFKFWLWCYVHLLMRLVYWPILQDFSKSPFKQYKFNWWNIRIKKWWQRQPPSKQGCDPPAQSPSWSPRPTWPRSYGMLWNFLIKKNASRTESESETASVCWNERNIESVLSWNSEQDSIISSSCRWRWAPAAWWGTYSVSCSSPGRWPRSPSTTSWSSWPSSTSSTSSWHSCSSAYQSSIMGRRNQLR